MWGRRRAPRQDPPTILLMRSTGLPRRLQDLRDEDLETDFGAYEADEAHD